ncbi:hypothetical protein NADFUDRAFT_53242 [Nadsonia fulvescens var. elongata DSM 6958]|uniref:MFS general substrate transporter n=1 Tax=Nadsonia fulvescens var. elongata DSM 6958 TaxID=857566 RepID=A0A1E3PDR1_9ASCO|nr:hypothetical protein NADFUDRAFT_53242 [Nadsonia fulvescens var. elongata DSM 6958]
MIDIESHPARSCEETYHSAIINNEPNDEPDMADKKRNLEPSEIPTLKNKDTPPLENEDQYLVRWDGLDDHENVQQNMSLTQKSWTRAYVLGPLSEFYGRRPTAFMAVSAGTIPNLFTKSQIGLPMILFTLTPITGPAPWPFGVWVGYIYGYGAFVTFNSVLLYTVDTYQQYTNGAVSANSFVRSMMADAFPLFDNFMYEGMGFHWASNLLAFISILMIPSPFIF